MGDKSYYVKIILNSVKGIKHVFLSHNAWLGYNIYSKLHI
jgi:hypothetical protein